MTLNPGVQAVLQMFADFPPLDYTVLTAEQLRAVNDQPMAFGEPIAMARVEDISIPLEGRTLAARLYIPEGVTDNPPLTLFFHGGGWVCGTLETHDGTSRALARASGSALLSVAYRLAPEYPYPVPLDDCYQATLWASAHGEELGVDVTRLAVAGDSAGGNLAAAVAIRARDAGGPAIRHQLLLYPVVQPDFAAASYQANGSGEYFLSTDAMRWYWQQYIGDGNVDATPLAALAGQNLAGLPPATVITAQYDPLRDEGNAYAEKLAAAGVPVDHYCAPGMIHGFASMFELVPDAMISINRAGDNLRSALA